MQFLSGFHLDDYSQYKKEKELNAVSLNVILVSNFTDLGKTWVVDAKMKLSQLLLNYTNNLLRLDRCTLSKYGKH